MTSRTPDDTEAKVLLKLLEKNRAAYKADPKAAERAAEDRPGAAAEGRRRGRTGRVDGRVPGAAEPERNDHAGVTPYDAVPTRSSRPRPRRSSSRTPASASAPVALDALLLDRDARAPADKYRGLAGLAAPPAEGQAGHLPVHVRRAEHLETFDYKPKLDKLDGKPMPESFTKGQPIAQLQGAKLKVQGHLTKFKQHGKSGQWVSDFLP